MDIDTNRVLDTLYQELGVHTAHHAGYPYNLSFEHEPFSRFLKYSLNNLGDPYVDGNYAIGTKSIERDVIGYFSRLYRLDDAWGYVTSCGTEGNYYGLWLGTRLLQDAAIFASRDSHYSVGKAAAIAKTKLIYVESDPAGEMDYASLGQLVQAFDGPAIVNVNIGTTVTGAVDRVERVCEIMTRTGRRFHLHCDGALGGLLEPFLADASSLDFARYPIGSVSVSGHKFVGAAMPCGVVLARKFLVRQIEQRVEYIGSSDTTIMGSRNGLAPLFIWHAIRHRDFAREARECRRNAEYLCNQLARRGWNPLLNDSSTTVVFDKPPEWFCRHWQLATSGNRAHVVVMQNHSRTWLDGFLRECDRAAEPALAAG